MLDKIPPKYDLPIIGLVSAFFFLPLLGGVHLFDWDEINFAECAREMIVLEEYLRVHINFHPFWEKPPLFFWMQVLAMKVFGIGEYAARFPNAICGIVSLCTLFLIGKKVHNRAFGYLWVLAYIGSVLPHLYFKSGIIDPWFNLFIFLGIYYLVQASWQRNKQENPIVLLCLAGLFTGLAILTKGPAAALITGLVLGVYFIFNRFRWYLHIGQFLFYGIITLLTAGLWFGIEIWQNGTWFVETFIRYQIRLFQTEDAGHGGFFGYHFVVLLIGVFPASIFALQKFWEKNSISKPKQQQDFRRWMLILFWVVLILFSLVQSKIVHYSSLCYFPLTYLAALRLQELTKGKFLTRLEKALLIGLGSIFTFVLILLPYLGQNIELLKPFLQKDPFALGNLEALVDWSWWDLLPAFLLVGVLASFVYFWQHKQPQKSVFGLFVGMAFFVNIALIFFINKIEGYSQNAAIEFYESKIEEDCYVYPLHRTYANLFYTLQKSPYNEKRYVKDWFFEGEIDKDVYFVSKVNHLHRLEKYKDVKELYRKNGFVFLKRSASK